MSLTISGYNHKARMDKYVEDNQMLPGQILSSKRIISTNYSATIPVRCKRAFMSTKTRTYKTPWMMFRLCKSLEKNLFADAATSWARWMRSMDIHLIVSTCNKMVTHKSCRLLLFCCRRMVILTTISWALKPKAELLIWELSFTYVCHSLLEARLLSKIKSVDTQTYQ